MSASNLQRLLAHLKPESLAARLVAARIDNEGGEPKEVLGSIINARLHELKRKHVPNRET